MLRRRCSANISRMLSESIHTNITKVLRQVSISAEKYQRDPAQLTVMAVSKTQSAEAVACAADAGIRDFGENYLQEALDKIDALEARGIIWHFIGPIQSNKTKAIAAKFSWVHSVDREKILRRLNQHRGELALEPLNICLQVNVSGEASKSGVSPAGLPELVAVAQELPHLRLRGLMAIPAPETQFERQLAACQTLASLYEKTAHTAPEMDTLSIGMSADMDAAIAAGSTMLRIGTAIFGPRQQQAPG